MHKWKRAYFSIIRKNQKINLKNEDGFTLVELLASIALLSVVILLVGSVHMFGQKQYQTQAYSASQSRDYAYSLSMISKEIRSTPFGSITVSESGDSIVVDGVVLFSQQGSQLVRGEGQVLAEDVADFIVALDSDAENVRINLTSKSEKNSQSKEFQTTIYFRR